MVIVFDLHEHAQKKKRMRKEEHMYHITVLECVILDADSEIRATIKLE